MEEKIIELRYFGDVDSALYKVVNPKVKRSWMDETDNNAYRCTPLNVANTYGWQVLCPMTFTAEWNGGPLGSDTEITIIDFPNISTEKESFKLVATNFGHGILSFVPDFIVKTPPGVSTYVRGIPNLIANGIQPLDGVVETDWLPFTFTYNFKFIKPGKIRFEKGQALFSFFPVQRGYVEEFDTKVSNISEYPEFESEYQKYSNHRGMQEIGATKEDGHYGRGESPIKKHDVTKHLKTSKIKEFKY
jgi:hypothetical protein